MQKYVRVLTEELIEKWRKIGSSVPSSSSLNEPFQSYFHKSIVYGGKSA